MLTETSGFYKGILSFITGLLLFTIIPVFSQQTDPTYQLVTGNNFVQSKNYYLLTLFSHDEAVQSLLKNDVTLSAIAKTKQDSVANALLHCGREGLCYINRLKFSNEEIKQVSEKLAELYKTGNALDKLVKDHLIPSGTYSIYHSLPPKQLLVKAWEQDANGINFALDVYAGGGKPHYPFIDSISFRTKDNNNAYLINYVDLLYNTASLIALENKSNPTFYSVPLTAALHFLEMNQRNQAADYEPMSAGENKAAYQRVKTVQWKDYKYSLILVPGAGPEESDVELSAESMLRCRLAALQFKKGVAPFIVTSGGKVHPYKTKYCEAAEMKKYLIETLHIPANAIIIEPHARHTTTNMRNTARIMYRNGFPFTMPALTCTTRGQSTYIGTTLIDRCQKELNEVPFKLGKRLTETELEFYPLVGAMQINPEEPMDP